MIKQGGILVAYYVIFMIAGYLSGSVLYAKIFGYIFRRRDIIKETKDRNPGTANAFMQGGFFCGICTLVCDILKGFLPVALCIYYERFQNMQSMELGLALVIAAPVAGHIFPVFYHFRGGKGIATTFGCLLGLFPELYAAETLAFYFILLSLVIRVTPHYYRTLGAFLLTLISLFFAKERIALRLGYFMINMCVMIRLFFSKEEKEACKVRLLWMH